MKLKYYLRGLGIGMIVTALILGISFSSRQEQAQTMTDDQIRERAAELGMVDSSELTLAALQNGAMQPTESTPQETQTQNSPEAATEQEETQTPETNTEPEVTINRGDDSGSVSRRLYEAGLVENAKAFDNYLCNNGYSRSINPGTYEIVPGSSEEEIAKIITGKQ
mgnify:CR=1 FL=1